MALYLWTLCSQSPLWMIHQMKSEMIVLKSTSNRAQKLMGFISSCKPCLLILRNSKTSIRICKIWRIQNKNWLQVLWVLTWMTAKTGYKHFRIKKTLNSAIFYNLRYSSQNKARQRSSMSSDSKFLRFLVAKMLIKLHQ